MPKDGIAHALTLIRRTILRHLGTVCGLNDGPPGQGVFVKIADMPEEIWPALHDPHLALGDAMTNYGVTVYNGEHRLEPYPLDDNNCVLLCHYLLIFYILLYRAARSKQIALQQGGAPVDLHKFIAKAAGRVMEVYVQARMVDPRRAELLLALLQQPLRAAGMSMILPAGVL